jgi:threonine dehydrogenase-like Zn-dependent dehydrogenase
VISDPSPYRLDLAERLGGAVVDLKEGTWQKASRNTVSTR